MSALRRIVALIALAAMAGGCALGTERRDEGLEDPGDCIVVDAAVSSEKIDLLTDLARTFNDSDDAAVDDECVFVRVQKKASGAAQQLLAEGWPDPDTDGPRPVIWSPAASSWGAILNQRLADRGEPPMAPQGTPFMLTPLVIAMPRPMAQALGWPDAEIGYRDILDLATSGAGWADKGHPEWGAFKLGKTNPNFSTSGLSSTIASYYAATGKARDLSLEDLGAAEVDAFVRGVESSVVHYGDITMTFLNNWFRNDARGTALTYVSAVAIEEKSVVDYNNGNPDGILDPGEKPRKPRVPLVAIYPKEGTLYSDNPLFILNAPWVDAAQKEGARKFEEYVRRPENQRRALEFGFRPGNPQVAVGAPITKANGVDPEQPRNVLPVPEPEVLTSILDLWATQRKEARVLLLIDVSGSMGDPATEDELGGPTKLDLAQQAAIDALVEFKAEDQVGLRIFTTDLRPEEPTDYVDLVPINAAAGNREELAQAIRGLIPQNGTPLYTAAQGAYDDMVSTFDDARINAVVLLTDGRNEDPRNPTIDGLLQHLRADSEGQATHPVRIFTIGYGFDADLGALRRIAEATNAAAYDASDPASISKVFTAVVSNF
jgi:Ca-activated chloride channel homolog